MKICSLGICLLIYSGVFAQDTDEMFPMDSIKLTTSLFSYPLPSLSTFNFQLASQNNVIAGRSISHIPSLDHLPSLFCKLEYQLQSKSKLAPRFRLGSLYYTEWMEGKRDYYMRYYK